MSSPICYPQIGPHNQCIIRSFADGDTCTIAVRCSCAASYHIAKLRLVNIDSWEPSTPTKEMADIVKKKLESQFKYKRGELFLRIRGTDKYGRIIGDIRIDGKMLSETIVEQGLGWFIT